MNELLTRPIAWVVGRPWIGKSTVAADLYTQLRSASAPISGTVPRVTLTWLGSTDTERRVPPAWWDDWLRSEPPLPAVWLIDGVDEVIGSSDYLLHTIATLVEEVPVDHLRELRLVLFSRPYAELISLRNRLESCYTRATHHLRLPYYWLTRLDAASAAALVGSDRFPAVAEIIRQKNLRSVAGYPVILNFLKTHHRGAERLTIPGVWRGVLTALLGEPSSHRSLGFDSTEKDRFEAACRIAAVLSLTDRKELREYSLDPDEITTGILFKNPDNRRLTAAREVCESALFVRSGEPPVFRFIQRNAQDWLTAFALVNLPLPAMRSALADQNGCLAARFREVGRLLGVVRPDLPTRNLIDALAGGVVLPTDAVEPSLAEVMRVLDHLEQLAAASPWGLNVRFDLSGDLARLRVTGLGNILADRLRDTTRPARVKEFLIDVARATNATEAVEVAIELILDRSQADELRVSAMYLVTHLGGVAHLRNLATPIAEGNETSDVGCRLRGILLSELLSQEIWPLWRVAIYAPQVKPGLIDRRCTILRSIEGEMTIEDARQLLPFLGELFRRHANDSLPHKLPAIVGRAIDLLLGESPPHTCDIDAILAFVFEIVGDTFGWITARELAGRLCHDVSARRRLYRHDIETAESRRLLVWQYLKPEDWRWLRDQAMGEWCGSREVWGLALWLAERDRENGHLAEDTWQEFLRLVDEQAPGLRAERESARRRNEQDVAEDEALFRQGQQPRERENQPLVDRIHDLLDRPGLTPRARMLDLGWLYYTNLQQSRLTAGQASIDLPVELQFQVIDSFLRGLEDAEPTVIPSAGSFPGEIMCEGEAFTQVVASRDHLGRVTETLIRRWLPTTLFSRMSNDWAGPIATCATISTAATEAALLKTITLHACRDSRPFVLTQIPPAWWTGALTQRLVELIADDTICATTRRELLVQLAVREPASAEPFIQKWAVRAVSKDEKDNLRQAGRNLLLIRDPAGALDLIEADFMIRGAIALEELPSLWEDQSGNSRRIIQWPLSQIERISSLLLRGYPPTSDPEFHGGFVAPNHELRWLRDRLISDLLAMADHAASGVLDRLSELDPLVRARVDTHRANERAAQFLPKVELGVARDPGACSVVDAVNLLDRAEYRLIRSADDLLEAVLEAMRGIDASAGHDLPMLYGPPDGSGGRVHLHEDALQAYLRRRLSDCLSRLTDGVQVQIVREDQIARRQRLDLRVTAPCHGGGRLAIVVVEMKWSTNDETRSGLVDQLGERYLIGEGLAHGVFAVGWCGAWFPRDRTGRNTDLTGLRDHLTQQRDAYCQPGQPGANLRIEPFVMDLRWSRTES